MQALQGVCVCVWGGYIIYHC